MIDTSLFPYESFPYRLEFGEKKDLAICWFECDEHLQKYVNRYKLDPKKITIIYRDAKPIKSSATDKKKVRQTTGKSRNRSADTSGRNTKNVDAPRNTARTRKPKSKQ